MFEEVMIFRLILKESVDALVLAIPTAEFNNNMGQILALTLSTAGGTKGIVGTEHVIFELLWMCSTLGFLSFLWPSA